MMGRLHWIYLRTELKKRWFSSRFTNLGKSVLLITCIALFFGINVQRTMIYLIFCCVMSALLFSYLASLRYTPAVQLKKFLPKTCVAGRELKYRISIENSGSATSMGVQFREAVREYFPDRLEFYSCKEEGEGGRNYFDRKMKYYRWLWLVKMGRKVEPAYHLLPDVPPGQKREVEVTLHPQRRGTIHLDGSLLSRIDPFGLCRREVLQKDERNLLVLPKIYQVPQLFFEGARKYHQGGITGANDLGDSNEFLSLREYVYGDPVKHIDWKATARTGRTIVKQYRDEYFSRYGLVLDNFTPWRFSRIFEEAVSLGASVLLSQDTTNSVLDLLFVENECVTCTMGRGLDGHQRMLEILASVSTCRNKPFSDLAALVQGHAHLLSGVILIFIDFDTSRRALLDHLQANSIPNKAIVLVENREEFEKQQREIILGAALHIIEVEHVEEQIARI